MKLVEFTGVTGGGKSTLIPTVKTILEKRDLKVTTAHEFVLRRHHLLRVRNDLLRTLLIDLIAVFPAIRMLMTTRDARRLIALATRELKKSAPPFATGLNLLRHLIRKIGVHGMLQGRQADSRDDVILWDEGMLHLAHLFLVQVDHEPSPDSIAEFNAIPLAPDLAIWIAASPERSVNCTLKRGHKRVPPDPAAAEAFVEHANVVFDTLFSSPSCKVPPGKWRKVDIPDEGSDLYADAAHQVSEFIIEHLGKE